MKGFPKTLYIICKMLCTTAILYGCKKFVDINPPQTQLATESVFEEKNTATAAVTGIYGAMSSMLYLNIYTGLSSDEFTSYGTDIYPSLYTNSLTEKNATFLFWSSTYNFIYQANAAINGLQDSKGIEPGIRDQLLGEAKFIRAFWYFYLTNLYGDVPLVTTIDYSIITKLPRVSSTAVYDQIVNDLKEAQILLGNNYVDSKNKVTQDRVRPTKWVATALLARVYLFNKDFRNAEIQSTSLIDNRSTFQLCQNLNSVFLKNSSETIWQLMPPLENHQTPEGSNFILTTAPNPSNGISISPQLLQAFEPGDQRMRYWIDSIVVSGSVYYFPYKYKIQHGNDELLEYSMVLRLSEQFLIRSEARIQLNNLQAGAADLDSIRIRAGLKAITAATQNDLLTAILHERQIELFSEGHRWIDLKVTGKADQIMTKVTPEKGGGKWQSYQKLYPIPLKDIQTSQNLQQNPEY